VDVLRLFTKLKARLAPYLQVAARYAHTAGIPMMRAMALEFPSDRACSHLERQYMLGDDLLVAPVLSADGDISYYVPEGTWTHFLTGERVEGGRWARERHGFMSVPLLARPAAVIPVGAVDDRPDYNHAEGVTLRVYELPDGASVTTVIPASTGDDACAFTTSRHAGVIRIDAADAPSAWHALLVGVHAVSAVDGGTAVPDEQGTLITAESQTLLITLNRP